MPDLERMTSGGAVRLFFDDDSSEQKNRLDAIEQNADFWCGLVYTPGDGSPPRPRFRSGIGLQTEYDVRENILEEFCDLTPERVLEVYNNMETDSYGRVSAEALGDALRDCGLSGFDKSVPSRILEAVCAGSDNRLQPADFEAILSRLKLAQLLVGYTSECQFLQQQQEQQLKQALEPPPQFSRDTVAVMRAPAYHSRYELDVTFARRLSVVDYDRRGTSVCSFSEARLREFFFGHRPSPKNGMPMVRWVHLSGLGTTLLLSLAVKYSLHPLAVEDVIEQCRTKMDRYGDHFFAAFEQLSLVGEPSRHHPVEVRGSHVSIFCSGPPNLDTVVTIAQADRSFSEDWPGFSEMSAAYNPRFDAAEEWVARLRERLQAPLSRLRERKAHFLLVQVSDLITDELVKVTHAYTMRVGQLEADLHEKGVTVGNEWVDEMSLIRLQLAVVLRRLRGVLRAIRQLDTPDVGDLSGYLRDIMDHLDEAIDDASILSEKGGAIIANYERTVERYQDQAKQFVSDRLNNTLFALTAITTILMPLQLIAGVYGMNFVDEEGSPTIPELLLPHGYSYFWQGVCIYLLVCCILIAWFWWKMQANTPPHLKDVMRQGREVPKVSSSVSMVGPPARPSRGLR